MAIAALSALMLYAWPVDVGGRGGDHRDEAPVEQRVEDAPVDVDDVADEPEARVPLASAVIRPASSPESPTARWSWRLIAADDLPVHLTAEDHPGDVERLGVGDPQAVDELGLLAEAGHHVADLGTAAVDDDRAEADGAQQHDVGGERLGERLVDHGVAAELHDHDAAGELLDVRQRLDEDRGALGRVDVAQVARTWPHRQRRSSPDPMQAHA